MITKHITCSLHIGQAEIQLSASAVAKGQKNVFGGRMVRGPLSLKALIHHFHPDFELSDQLPELPLEEVYAFVVEQSHYHFLISSSQKIPNPFRLPAFSMDFQGLEGKLYSENAQQALSERFFEFDTKLSASPSLSWVPEKGKIRLTNGNRIVSFEPYSAIPSQELFVTFLGYKQEQVSHIIDFISELKPESNRKTARIYSAAKSLSEPPQGISPFRQGLNADFLQVELLNTKAQAQISAQETLNVDLRLPPQNFGIFSFHSQEDPAKGPLIELSSFSKDIKLYTQLRAFGQLLSDQQFIYQSDRELFEASLKTPEHTSPLELEWNREGEFRFKGLALPEKLLTAIDFAGELMTLAYREENQKNQEIDLQFDEEVCCRFEFWLRPQSAERKDRIHLALEGVYHICLQEKDLLEIPLPAFDWQLQRPENFEQLAGLVTEKLLENATLIVENLWKNHRQLTAFFRHIKMKHISEKMLQHIIPKTDANLADKLVPYCKQTLSVPTESFAQLEEACQLLQATAELSEDARLKSANEKEMLAQKQQAEEYLNRALDIKALHLELTSEVSLRAYWSEAPACEQEIIYHFVLLGGQTHRNFRIGKKRQEISLPAGELQPSTTYSAFIYAEYKDKNGTPFRGRVRASSLKTPALPKKPMVQATFDTLTQRIVAIWPKENTVRKYVAALYLEDKLIAGSRQELQPAASASESLIQYELETDTFELKAGQEYTLEVQAFGPHSSWQSPKATVRVEILPGAANKPAGAMSATIKAEQDWETMEALNLKEHLEHQRHWTASQYAGKCYEQGIEARLCAGILLEKFHELTPQGMIKAMVLNGYKDLNALKAVQQLYPDLPSQTLMDFFRQVNQYYTPDKQAKALFKEGMEVIAAARHLKKHFEGLKAYPISEALITAGYTQTESMTALRKLYPELTNRELANILQKLSFFERPESLAKLCFIKKMDATATADMLKQKFTALPAVVMAQALASAGYNHRQTLQGLQQAFVKITDEVMNDLLDRVFVRDLDEEV